MYEAVQKCTHCGANLTLDDLRKPNCTYCGTVYPHHAQAAQHAAVAGQVMNQMMAQQAQIQAHWQGAYGAGPLPPAPFGGAPGGQFGAAPGGPYADPQRIAAAHMQHVAGVASTIKLVVILVTVGVFLLVGVIVAVALLRI
ncbi:MAG: hypothetical protein IPK82_38125 [Polyangiaceae bacterium]|nr:hypothetical protein [Polyangiaceae bacterium]